MMFCKYPSCDVIVLVAMTHDELPACLLILNVLIAAQLDLNHLGAFIVIYFSLFFFIKIRNGPSLQLAHTAQV